MKGRKLTLKQLENEIRKSQEACQRAKKLIEKHKKELGIK
jgi:hypothetical protein